MASSVAGDVSLKSLYQSPIRDLGGSLDSSEVGVSPTQWNAYKISPSPSKMSLLSVDEAQFDELDVACTILNDLQSRGVISHDEKQRRRALVISFMEFAAADYGDEVHAHSWGPGHELLRLVASTGVRWYRFCCSCCITDREL